MPQRYVAEITGFTPTIVNGLLFHVLAPSNAVVEITEFRSGFDTPDGGNTKMRLQRNSNAPFAGGTAVTEVRCESGFSLPGATVFKGADRAGGSPDDEICTVESSEWGTWHWLPTPASRIIVSPGDRLELIAIGTTSAVVNGYLKWIEYGG